MALDQHLTLCRCGVSWWVVSASSEKSTTDMTASVHYVNLASNKAVVTTADGQRCLRWWYTVMCQPSRQCCGRLTLWQMSSRIKAMILPSTLVAWPASDQWHY